MNRRAFFSVVPAMAVAPLVPAVRAVSVGVDVGGEGFSIAASELGSVSEFRAQSEALREIRAALLAIRAQERR